MGDQLVALAIRQRRWAHTLQREVPRRSRHPAKNCLEQCKHLHLIPQGAIVSYNVRYEPHAGRAKCHGITRLGCGDTLLAVELPSPGLIDVVEESLSAHSVRAALGLQHVCSMLQVTCTSPSRFGGEQGARTRWQQQRPSVHAPARRRQEPPHRSYLEATRLASQPRCVHHTLTAADSLVVGTIVPVWNA